MPGQLGNTQSDGEGICGSAWSRTATRSRQAGDVTGFFSLRIVDHGQTGRNPITSCLLTSPSESPFGQGDVVGCLATAFLKVSHPKGLGNLES